MAGNKFLTFNNGIKMPAIGIGTWQAPEKEVEEALNLALEAGYRHIDCAPVYLNEPVIGRVLSSWIDSGKLKREDLFITTKLPPPALKAEVVERVLKKSLEDLQLSYVDLYLVHVPFGVMFDHAKGEFMQDEGGVVIDVTTDHLAIWKSMEAVLEKGLTKSIGVSNFNVKQIQRILDNCSVPPANLQIEHHVYLQQKELIDFCKEKGITVTAYAPLGSRGIANINKAAGVNRELPDLMDIELVKQIAADHGKTPAQVLLRWIIERGLSAIPKSTNPERLKQNLDVFDFSLSEEEVEKMNALDANIRVCDFAFFKGVERHPEFPFAS